MNKAVFYHAGCPVCVNAESRITELVDRGRYNVEIVHLGEQRGRIAEADGGKRRAGPAAICTSLGAVGCEGLNDHFLGGPGPSGSRFPL
ncbi:MAG: hypothetical protein IPN62_16300 [Flavobacteriales bacterium]|nr:hypothetical protein [Flavobacteriales bacterium]